MLHAEEGACPDDTADVQPDTTPPNTPPSLTLLTSPQLGPVVRVPLGVTYQPCAPGQVPTQAVPCELGAAAADAEGGDLSGQVLVCPPAHCDSPALFKRPVCRGEWNEGMNWCLGRQYCIPYVCVYLC